MARRLVAGALLAVVMTLSLAGVASAQSNSNTNSNTDSNTNTNTNTNTSSTSNIGGTGSLGRTGAEMWIPLALGGLVITVAFATRAGLARAASRTP
jgi:hypothetical protein